MRTDLNLLVPGWATFVISFLFTTNAFNQKLTPIPLTPATAVNQSFNNFSLHDLTLGSVQTIYLNNGSIEIPSNNLGNPIKVEVDASSVNLLNQPNSLFNDVKVIEFKLKSINELAQLRALTSLGHFPALKVIYFSCSFELCGSGGTEACEKQILENNMNEIAKPGLTVVYTSSLDN